MKYLTALDKAKIIARIASEKKGENIVLMNMQGISTVCDWFVLISASSSRRVSAISKALHKDLSKEKISPLHIEGKQGAEWILLDYEDVVVHVFYKGVREFYSLERLWSEAPSEKFVGKCLEKT
ncbi:MAG: ribosome silencing factor [Candidatus Omnitrophota bacterium]